MSNTLSFVKNQSDLIFSQKRIVHSVIINRFLACNLIETTVHKMPKKKDVKQDKGSVVKNTSSQSPIQIDPNKNISIKIYAKPGAKQNAITDVSDEGINVQINAPPVEGSANSELVKYIGSLLGVKLSSVSLERGHKSRNKLLKISGNITRSEVVKKINAELPEQSKLSEEG